MLSYRSTVALRGLLLVAFTLVLASCLPGGNAPSITTSQGGGFSPISDIDDVSREVTRQKVKIALLVPLSGKFADIGKASANAAHMALFDIGRQYYPSPPSVIILDTKGTQEGARAALERAVSQGANAIVGPVLSGNVAAITKDAQRAGLPVLSLSNNAMLAKEGVYVMGILPQDQLSHVLKYAHRTMNIEDFSALAPDDEYGVAVMRAFVDYLDANGMKNEAVAWYKGVGVELSKAIRKVASMSDEQKNEEKYQQVMDAYFFPGDNKQESRALVIPAGGRQLRSILSRLNRKGSEYQSFTLLGVGNWYDETLLDMPGFDGAIFAATPRAELMKFEHRYRKLHSRTPPEVAAITYDAVAMLCLLLKEDGRGAFAPETLMKDNGFLGVNGLFRLREGGKVQRAMEVLKAGGGKFTTLEPALTDFSEYDAQQKMRDDQRAGNSDGDINQPE